MVYDNNDLFRELNLENNRCQKYFDLMYKTLQFTFVAIVALIVCAFSKGSTEELQNLILCILIPICVYVFGIMYAYNAYALSICGKRAEIIHSNMYKIEGKTKNKEEKQFHNVLCTFVVTNRKVTLISYGVPLGFYLVVPLASYYVGMKFFKSYPDAFLKICPIICLVVYNILMLIIIYAIAKDFFEINKIQKNR